MDFRNKYLLTTVRVIFGLAMLASGISGLLMGDSMENVPPDMVPFTQALWDSGIFQMIKVTEAVVGLMLITGFLPWLAAIFMAPVAVGIIVVNARLTPSFLFIGIIVAALNIYLGYAYWEKYKGLFKRK
jgi:uncharacterized membrane protein YphA (DoxX/SURF4 family)